MSGLTYNLKCICLEHLIFPRQTGDWRILETFNGLATAIRYSNGYMSSAATKVSTNGKAAISNLLS